MSDWPSLYLQAAIEGLNGLLGEERAAFVRAELVKYENSPANIQDPVTVRDRCLYLFGAIAAASAHKEIAPREFDLKPMNTNGFSVKLPTAVGE